MLTTSTYITQNQSKVKRKIARPCMFLLNEAMHAPRVLQNAFSRHGYHFCQYFQNIPLFVLPEGLS